MIRLFLFITTLFLFNLDILSKIKKDDKILENPLPSMENFWNENYHNESHVTDPEKIFKNYRIIRREPDKAADAFLILMNGRSSDDQKKFIEENFDKVSYLLFNLDNKRSDKFDDVLKIVIENSFPINPSYFTNFEELASQMILSYVTEFNNRLRMSPLEHRVPEISTSTLNYDNAINNIIELAKTIRTQPVRALIKAEEISKKYSKNPSVQNGVARLFLDNGDFKNADKYTTRAIDVDENNYDAYTMRAQARYSLKDIKNAIEDVKKATEIDPSNETTKLLTSFITKSANFSKVNLNSVKDSFASDGVEATVESNFEIKKISSNDVGSGNINTKEISIDEKKSNFYLKNAIVKTQMEDYDQAIKYFNLAIEKNPDNIDAYIERANAYNLIGNYDDAIKDATYVLKNDPQNIHALNIRAWGLYKKGDLENAYNDTTKAIYLKPNYADAMFLRALIYEKQNKFDEMLTELEKASKINPNYVSRFHDAIASYSYRAPNFMKYYDRNKDMFKITKTEDKSFDIKKFLFLLALTIVGGIFIGVALLHAFSPKLTTHTYITQSTATDSNVLTPNIFYEGVATGKYKIIRKIGQGGMGSVYLAIDQTLNREVAIKKMNEDIKMNEREKQRFIDEARTVAMLHHPNIIEIYTIFEEKNDIYLVFEYIDGISLDRRLDREIRMPFFEVKEIVFEISKALSYAHSKNVVHRDLKLSNVMVSKDGYIKVMDFGLAKVIREAKERYSSSEVVGSPAYMAPEQDLGIFVKESDLYSLGICIYEMLVGELPFNGPDYHYQKEKKLYTPLSQIVVGLPNGIDEFMSKLLEPQPENRYHSVEEFLEDFKKLT